MLPAPKPESLTASLSLPSQSTAVSSRVPYCSGGPVTHPLSPSAVLVAGGVHWLLSTLFPDHASIIERAVSSDDVLDAKVFDDYTSTAATTSAERVGENRSVEEKEAAMLKAEGAV